VILLITPVREAGVADPTFRVPGDRTKLSCPFATTPE
jgi:hypothetical protein